MAIFAALCGLALVAPLLAFLQQWPRGASPQPPLTRRRLIRDAALAGSLGIVPIAFIITLGAYGDWIVLLLFCVLGGIYGALVGVTVTWLRMVRHRDRTD